VHGVVLPSHCPFCGFLLIAGPARDEPALPIPSAEARAQGHAALKVLADYHRMISKLLTALEARNRRQGAGR
jgi:hypothetical protein